ncbi:hypothetical protein QFC19_008557 [Naganishia cerealis]|uniref:Uncharacterized protein n=1 Tax=Naganishia cerealis TaxID=610337 RepID=A0ACC2V194_9TREE|nr:hypothetical protein QFC19_008557 [Naganishia cerealis]
MPLLQSSVSDGLDLTLRPAALWKNTLVPSPNERAPQPQVDYCFPPRTQQCPAIASLTLKPKFAPPKPHLSAQQRPVLDEDDDLAGENTLIVDEMDGFDTETFDREMAKLAQDGMTRATPPHRELDNQFSPRQWWGDVGKRHQDDRFTDVDLQTSTSITMIDSDLNMMSRRGSQLFPGTFGVLASGLNTRRSSACVPVHVGRRPSGVETFADLVRRRASESFKLEEDRALPTCPPAHKLRSSADPSTRSVEKELLGG